MASEVVLLVINADITGNVEKAQILARRKYLSTAFFLISDRRQYEEVILLLINDYEK